MINDIIRYRLDYGILAIISCVYIVFFLSNQQDTSSLLIGTVAFGLAYVVWGIFHHLRTHTLHSKVVLEYLLVSSLAILLVSTLLI